MALVEMKTFRIGCDYCYRTEDYQAIYMNDRWAWPEGWVVVVGEGVGGNLKDYHYCPVCKEIMQGAGS